MNFMFNLFGRHRWYKRLGRFFNPRVFPVHISEPYNFDIYINPLDCYGPSFYIHYGGADAFASYEKQCKEILS